MVATQLPISNVITISVSQTPTGVAAFNTSNLALFSTDTPSPSFTSGYKIYLEPTSVGTDFGTGSTTYKMANAVFSQQPNILLPGGYLVVIPFTSSETIDAAITRTVNLVPYFGCMSTRIESQVDMLAAAAVLQPLQKMGFFVQDNPTSIDSGGALDLLRTGSFTHSRGLFYDDTDANSLLFQAAYAGRALSVVFSGSNTTITMNLKTLAGIAADPGLTQALLTKAIAAGADSYPSIQGVSCVNCSGANSFFDQIYNLLSFAAALQIAGFNFLASSSTKVPQTENAMDAFKAAYIAVCAQYVTNQYLAPGTWNSSTTFGNQADFYQGILQRGYYVYSAPIAQQLQVDRVARKAPLVQIAAKEAGAFQSGSVIVIVNQ